MAYKPTDKCIYQYYYTKANGENLKMYKWLKNERVDIFEDL